MTEHADFRWIVAKIEFSHHPWVPNWRSCIASDHMQWHNNYAPHRIGLLSDGSFLYKQEPQGMIIGIGPYAPHRIASVCYPTDLFCTNKSHMASFCYPTDLFCTNKNRIESVC